MIIKTVTRSYSRTINTKSYGSPAESWVKVEATYTAECESNDDPLKVSEMLSEQSQKDVAGTINNIAEKIKQANPGTVPATIAPTAPAPVTNAPRQL